VNTGARPATAAATPVAAWLEVVGVSRPAVERVARSLLKTGVQLQRRDAPGGPRNGVVVFDGNIGAAADAVKQAASSGPGCVIALRLAGDGHADESWGLLHAGASDVIAWSDASARQVAERLRRWQMIDELVESDHVRNFLVGESRAWRAVLRDAVEVARFTDAAVLVTGESGTGKERVAQLIHELDPRRNKQQMVVLDCSTVVPSLSGSEFFGHEKGAFTGASAPRAGAFELANGGTLFLDEVGELPAPLQAELLRVIQEGTFKRVGSNTWRKSAFRLVCATNRDLATEQGMGTFRNDFYYRIAGCTLHLPSLRDRPEDILPLFDHFFREAHPDREPPELEDAVREMFLSRSYPGNVRDLRSLVLRIIPRYLGAGVVTVGDIPDHERPVPSQAVAAWRCSAFDESIRRALSMGAKVEEITATAAELATELAASREGGDVSRAARTLERPLRSRVSGDKPAA
jgi:transcriptional regulator with GAF, ATPase, and Fis domain